MSAIDLTKESAIATAIDNFAVTATSYAEWTMIGSAANSTAYFDAEYGVAVGLDYGNDYDMGGSLTMSPRTETPATRLRPMPC